MNYLSIENVGRDLGEYWLFKDLTFGILQGEKVGLIGTNGSGKSTLMRMITGEMESDGGVISIRKDIRVGYLEQDPYFDAFSTVIEVLFSADNEITRAIASYEKALAKGENENLAKAIETLDALNAWDYESKVKQILGKLGITDFDQSVSTLSGGQRKRIALARVLIENPDFILLDEPTNHLDLVTIEWLEGFLSANDTTILLVTHDRYFLDAVCNRIVEIDNGKIYKYDGNYAYFLEKKEERISLETASYEKNKNRLSKELEWMRRQPKARTTKAQYRIDAFHDLKEKTKNYKPTDKVSMGLKTERLGKKILEIDYITKAFGDKKLLEDFTYTFKRKDKIGVVGANGVGKSTFLEIILGNITPDRGKINRGETLQIGYFSQQPLEFEEDQKVIDVIREIADYIKMDGGREISASALLTLFLFPPARQYQHVFKLSGGEKRRLQLLKVLAGSPNFLILDEPTNDLDIDTLNVLEEFLEEFGGCVLVVSHDRYFMDRVVDHVFAFEGNGVIKDFPGNYTQYRYSKEEGKKQIEPEEKEVWKSNRSKQKLNFKEKLEFESLEKEIKDLEERKVELLKLLNGLETDYQKIEELGKELEVVQEQLGVKEWRWLELADRSH